MSCTEAVNIAGIQQVLEGASRRVGQRITGLYDFWRWVANRITMRNCVEIAHEQLGLRPIGAKNVENCLNLRLMRVRDFLAPIGKMGHEQTHWRSGPHHLHFEQSLG